MTGRDLREVDHTGGKVTFYIECDAEGRIRYSINYSHSSCTPATLSGVYAHPDGFACENVQLGGINQPWNKPPFPNCIAVMMASDSEGKFGHECPSCQKHFRTLSIPAYFPLTCPYCGLRAPSFHFLTPPQEAYVRHYVMTLNEGIEAIDPGSSNEVVIDMDAIADAVPGEPRPDFYYNSTVQQTQFLCATCKNYNDVRGRYAYCADCGWRSNVASLNEAFTSIRERLNTQGLTPAEAIKQAVSEFDSAARDFIDQLEARTPMKNNRRRKLQELLFHNLDRVNDVMKRAFDINMLQGMDGDRDFINRMFLRRHVYEHDGGVATARYVRESGDSEIEEGVIIRETVENVHRLISCLNRMAKTIETDFHEIFPPEPFCIERERERSSPIRPESMINPTASWQA